MSSLKKFRDKKKGFTLIELIVVIAIIGILAAILLPRFGGFTDSAREKSAMSEAKAVYTEIESYYAEHGKYPSATSELKNVKPEIIANVTLTNAGNNAAFTYSPKAKDGTTVITTITCDADGKLTAPVKN